MKTGIEKIRFHYLYKPFYFPERKKLKTFIYKQLQKEGKKVDVINYIFCDDEYLLELNRTYLKHDTLTDIVTFEFSENGHALLSDIYISVERVKENAAELQVRFMEELRRVIFHGALHLAAYKDKNKVDRDIMRKKEEEYLSQYKVSRNTAPD